MKLSNVAVCFSCFCRVFPGWGDGKIGDWLITQAEGAVAWAESHTKEALEARAERDKEAYEEWLSV